MGTTLLGVKLITLVLAVVAAASVNPQRGHAHTPQLSTVYTDDKTFKRFIDHVCIKNLVNEYIVSKGDQRTPEGRYIGGEAFELAALALFTHGGAELKFHLAKTNTISQDMFGRLSRYLWTFAFKGLGVADVVLKATPSVAVLTYAAAHWGTVELFFKNVPGLDPTVWLHGDIPGIRALSICDMPIGRLPALHRFVDLTNIKLWNTGLVCLDAGAYFECGGRYPMMPKLDVLSVIQNPISLVDTRLFNNTVFLSKTKLQIFELPPMPLVMASLMRLLAPHTLRLA